MNNLKKLGVTALAGSLMSLSVSATEVTIAGMAEVTYTTQNGTLAEATTGNPFGMRNNVNFGMTGDVNGMTVSWFSLMNDAMSGVSSAAMSIDMGAMGLVAIDQGSGGYGIATADDSILPTAYEEPSHGGGADSLPESGSNNVIGYKNSFMGVNINAEYNPNFSSTDNADGASSKLEAADAAALAKGSGFNYVLSYDIADGLTVGAGSSTVENVAVIAGTQDAKEVAAYVKYATGAVSVGYFMNESQGGDTAGHASSVTDGYSVAFAVNENLSISYADRSVEVDTGTATKVTEENKAAMASYTMGSASVRVAYNKHDNLAGALGSDLQNTEISLVLAF